MSVHIKIGDKSWCRGPYGYWPSFEEAAHKERIPLSCAHANLTKAQRMIELIKEHLDLEARIVEGPCDQQDDGY
jgi:hypothetical protein